MTIAADRGFELFEFEQGNPARSTFDSSPEPALLSHPWQVAFVLADAVDSDSLMAKYGVKITVEGISEKIQELFPSIDWEMDLERIRRMLGRKESE